MLLHRSFLLLFFLILTYPALSRADSSLGTSTQGQDEKAEAVNQQLNMFDGPQLKPGDAEKEFSDTPSVTPSALATVKRILNPDLSPPSQEHCPKPPSHVRTRAHTLDIGSEISYYRYKEPSYEVTANGAYEPQVRIRGPMYGYYANYAYRPADPNFFNNFLTNVYMLQARYASSHNLEYTSLPVTGLNKHDEEMEYRGLIGKDYFIGRDTMLTPYFGFGYRYLKDNGNGQYTIIGRSLYYGYDRKSHYYYLPLGGDAVVEMPKNWEIDLNAEYDIFLQGYQKSYISDGNQFGANNTDLVNHQDHGFGIRGSIKFLKRGSMVDFYVEPYIRYWHIDQSKPELVSINGAAPELYGEPDNNTIEAGSKFGIQF